jgi:hypothetical protein
MRPIGNQSSHAVAVLTLAEIKAATEAFDRGDSNVFDTLDAIVIAVEVQQNAAASRREAA